jgi:BMFP domain-containing protein YqiC
MQSQNKFFDDLAKVVNGAAGTMAGMAREAQAASRERAREWIGGLDLVSREEFEVQKDLLTAARAEIEALKAEVAALRGGAAAPAAAAAPAKRTRKPKG